MDLLLQPLQTSRGLHGSLPCEHSWGSPARRSTSPPRSWSSSHLGTAPTSPVLSSTGLAETSFCHLWRRLWLAAAGRQSEPPVRRWADATAPHKSLNDAWAVLKYHTHTVVVVSVMGLMSSELHRDQNPNREGWMKRPPSTCLSVH